MRSSWLALCETPRMPKLPQTLQENSYFSKTKATIFTKQVKMPSLKSPLVSQGYFLKYLKKGIFLKNLLFIAPSQILHLLIIANTVINNKLL